MTALYDLTASAREHIEFLRSVHLCERDLYHAGYDLCQAIAAYVDSWLVKLNDSTNDSVVELPALDVAWIWYLHKTDPLSYQRDCIRWYGRILDVPIGVNPFQHSSSLSTPTKQKESDECPKIDTDFMERIISSAKNKSSFLWHVNWPEYEDGIFLEESVERYEMMLLLMTKNPTQFIVPTYDIDNIWHTHLAFPSRYIEDCRKVVGHDVGTDRSSGSLLSQCSATTESLWNETFSCPWRNEGAMSRGEPPSWYWSDRRRAAARPGPALPSSASRFTRSAVEVVGLAFGNEGGIEVRSMLAITWMQSQH